MRNIIILGTGGNCIDILDTLNEINKERKKRFKCLGFLDDNEKSHGTELHGYKVLGPLNQAGEIKDCLFVNGIGSENNFWHKSDIIGQTGVADNWFATLIHPSASVSSLSSLGVGTVIFQNVTITSNVSIGKHVIVLPNTIISHDDLIGDYSCIAGGCCISGGVTIGHSCYLGTNSSIRGNLTIGDRSLIGMGSTVTKKIPDNQVWFGTPARYVRNLVE